MNSKIGKILLAFGLFSLAFSFAQNNVPPNLDAIGDQFYCPLSQINIVSDFNIVDPDDNGIDELNIQISTGYVNGEDQLVLTGTHPNIQSTWNTASGKLTLSGIGGTEILYTDLIAAVKDVVFSSSSASVSGDKYFSFTIGDANFLPSTGHYYEYVPASGITWANARTAAAARSYYGLQGYLATIGSVEEAQLSGEQAGGAGWLGGTDEAVEGVWRWVTGPEAGTIFWNGGINGSTPNFANWNTNEPNNCCGGEDYVHVTFNVGNPGSWNDLPNQGSGGNYFPQGYIVEYGGMLGDPIVDISASTKITIPSIDTITEASSCGPSSVNLEANASAGNVIWFDTPTGGMQLATGNTFTTPNISATTTYYTLASVNGCLEGTRTPVTSTINEIPVITSVSNATICDSGSGVLMAAANLGIINWYDSMVGGTLLATGSSFTTPSVANSTTYYVDATSNGCTSSSRTAVTLTVQKTAVPTGNTFQSFCDIDNASISDLTVSGNSILWYDTASGGTVLVSSEALVSQTYYASQTVLGCESLTRLAVDVMVYATVIPVQPSEIPVLRSCDSNLDGDDTNGFTEFDLTLNEPTVLNGNSNADFQVNYFTDAGYSNQITNPNGFVNTVQNNQTIYVRIENKLDNSCYSDTSFLIQVDSLPVINLSVILKNCDEDGTPDGFTEFNLNEANASIANNNSSDFEITFYLSNTEANSKTNPINPSPFNNATANTVFARIEGANGCFRVSTVNLQVSTTSFPQGYMQVLEDCDTDDTNDGVYEFDLTSASSQFIAQFPSGQNLSVHYYRNLTDAQLEQNEIVSATTYQNETPYSQTLFVRVESDDNGDCFGIGPHLTLTVRPRPNFEVDQNAIYCLNQQPITLYTFNPDGTYSYEWKDNNGMIVSNLPTATVATGGTYTVIATSSYGCDSFPVSFNVVESAIATIDIDDVTIVQLSDNNSITIDTTNLGIGDYEFALDFNSPGAFQSEPFFDHVRAGKHTIYIQDRNGCGIVALDVFVMGFPKFFTPNNDGFNDTWNLEGLGNEYSQQSSVYIYDRYGKLLKQINPKGQGWNGAFNGQIMETSDYWFLAELVDVNGQVSTYRGHFTLKR
ncbi:gliding motility-associated-like protein [Flavobacteriaceae bacterium MAR_2010_72]|nr:gliding motility-associated-like protein [Flavobacteriaceae bacterium MAR_2010_72]TVZ59346.1 gliding motility-associated-like protein [Flavobacteriaceae bacterium MAR_2010_105]